MNDIKELEIRFMQKAREKYRKKTAAQELAKRSDRLDGFTEPPQKAVEFSRFSSFFRCKKAVFSLFAGGLFAALALFCGAETLAEPTATDFAVAGVFSDHMVLQQNEPICIWGTGSEEGAVVGAKLADSYGTAVVENGCWSITLAARCASAEPLTLEVYGSAAAKRRAFEDILIGDVWLIAGQSNVEYSCASLPDGQMPVYDGVWEERVRFLSFDNGDIEEVEQKKKPASSALDRYTPYAKLWRKAAHTEVLGASALGICFAERLCKLGGEQIPIGVISLGFGGRELRSFVQPKNAEKLSGYGDKSSIYANFIEPLLKFPIRGVIWYQGEANAAYYSEYADGFLVFAEQLRADKAQTSYADFPFYLVELPPCFPAPDGVDASLWQYIDFGMVRAVSGTLPSKLKNCYICATSDLWSDALYANNLHPNNKPAIAERLAQMAAAGEWDFSEYRTVVAPTFLRAEPIDAEGYAYHVYFGRASGGLRASGALKGFDAIGEKWEPLDVLCEIVSPDCVRVTASAPIYRLRYAPETASVFGTDATLCNAAGIPTCAFSVDLKEFPVSISAVLHTCAVRIFQVIWRYRVLFGAFALAAAAGLIYICRRKRKNKLSESI